jgi:hypothetical protein
VVTTPAIENLADLCSTWAYYRYLWAFSPPGSGAPLALSEYAKRIDFHQKGLLSDQIGIGVAAVIMEDHFRAPLAADVDVAMEDPEWPIELRFDTSPDYLFFDETQANLFVVECKGTQSQRASAMDQLRRGTEQVPSLVFTDGRRPMSLVIATHLSTCATEVYVLDPPADKGHTPDSPSSAKRISEREYYVHDASQFSLSTRLISEAKVLAYAGSDTAAVTKLEQARVSLKNLPRAIPREASLEEKETGTFSGLRQSLPTRDNLRIEIFQGVERAVRDAYIADDVPRLKEELAVFQERVRTATEPTQESLPTQVVRGSNSVVVRSTSADGTMLEVSIQLP